MGAPFDVANFRAEIRRVHAKTDTDDLPTSTNSLADPAGIEAMCPAVGWAAKNQEKGKRSIDNV